MPPYFYVDTDEYTGIDVELAAETGGIAAFLCCHGSNPGHVCQCVYGRYCGQQGGGNERTSVEAAGIS